MTKSLRQSHYCHLRVDSFCQTRPGVQNVLPCAEACSAYGRIFGTFGHLSFLTKWTDTQITVTSASSHFVNKDKCPKCPKCPAGCGGLVSGRALSGLRTRKDIWTFRTLVLFDERTPTLKLHSLPCRVILPKRTSVQMSFRMRRPELYE